jgi:hypothetical protein
MTATIVPPPNDTAVVSPPVPVCPSCGSMMVAEFCARCGELQPAHRDLSLGAVAHEAVQEFVGVDGKIPRTVWALITKPGVLTREFIDGRRGRYSKPMSLFLVLNLIFFFIQPHTGLMRYNLSGYIGAPGDSSDSRAALMVEKKLARSDESRASYEGRFNSTLDAKKKSMLLFAVPVFAAVMALIFVGAKRYFVEHLVFAVHAYAFLLAFLVVGIWVIFYTLGGWVMIAQIIGLPVRRVAVFLDGEPVLLAVLLVATTTYIALAIRRAYGGSTRAAVLRALPLSFVQMGLVLLYHDLLFFTAFYATS